MGGINIYPGEDSFHSGVDGLGLGATVASAEEMEGQSGMMGGGVNALGLVTCDILSYPHITLSNVVCELITESFHLPKNFTFR